MERQRYATNPATLLRHLADHEAPEAGEMLARAFSDDPLCGHLFPDPLQRPAELAAALTWNVSYGLRYGEVLAPADSLDGAAVLLRPSNTHFSPERLLLSGYDLIEQAMGAERWSRFDAEFGRILGDADRALHGATDGRHWYLDVIGVDPARQGTGLGGALLGAVNARADAVGAEVALHTFQPSVLPFYQRFGYWIVCEGHDVMSGIRYWGCSRPPRPGAAGFAPMPSATWAG